MNIENVNCMLQKCDKCPGKIGIKIYLGTLEKIQARELIKYLSSVDWNGQGGDERNSWQYR